MSSVAVSSSGGRPGGGGGQVVGGLVGVGKAGGRGKKRMRTHVVMGVNPKIPKGISRNPYHAPSVPGPPIRTRTHVWAS